MALSDDDVREILRIIDETPLDELRIETDGFSLHVRTAAAGDDPVPAAPPPPEAEPANGVKPA
jgi:acetyl-CoA carboxylase biotin carboxyl carrier protein